MEVVKLSPYIKEIVWGGNTLRNYGKKFSGANIAECWELSLHKEGSSIIDSGVDKGKSLLEVLTKQDLGEKCEKFPFFPTLIKLINADRELSVQVHPSDEYALKNENSYGKTEMWYILEANKGSGIYLGFKRDVTKEEVREKESRKEEDLWELKERLEEKRYSHLTPEEQARYRNFNLFDRIMSGALFIIAVIVYFTVSALNPEQWQKLWVIFLLPVVISSLISCIKKRRFAPFAFPVLVAFAYLTIGMYLNIWHPTWIMFLAVPLFYIVVNPIDCAIAKRRDEKVDPDDFDEEDEKE